MNNENEVLTKLMKRFGEENKALNKTLNVDSAIRKAYGDMSKHAVGHRPAVKEEALKIFNKIFRDMPSFKNVEEFDLWHKSSCEVLRNTKLPNGFIITYGRAQKVINMAFKYLRYSDTPHADAYDYCHMTLDRYTLNWYEREVDKDKKHCRWSIIGWSKIDDYDEYKRIQDNIRDYLKRHVSYSIDINGLESTKTVTLPEQPLLAEFIIWASEKPSK